MSNRHLFEDWLGDTDTILQENVSALGRLPQEWWDRWEERGEFFEVDGTWKEKDGRRAVSRSLLLRCQQMGREEDAHFWKDEVFALEKMLRSMLQYEPEKRATAEDLVRSDWMVRFGLPSLREFAIAE